MNNLPLLFLGIFFTLAFSWTGLVLSSHLQIGGLAPTTSVLDEEGRPVAGEDRYPLALSGLAQQGKRVYIREGCMYCHSQQVRPKGFGADWERGWGNRQSVPRDYIRSERVLLGTMRTGPDLTNTGDRAMNEGWHHSHLYDPLITSPGSLMPAYPWLYEIRPIGEDGPAPDAVSVPEDSRLAPPAGYEVIPTAEARALVAYLLSLKLDYELPEIQFVE